MTGPLLVRQAGWLPLLIEPVFDRGWRQRQWAEDRDQPAARSTDVSRRLSDGRPFRAVEHDVTGAAIGGLPSIWASRWARSVAVVVSFQSPPSHWAPARVRVKEPLSFSFSPFFCTTRPSSHAPTSSPASLMIL
ncbi:hypothetical protein [Streptomyces kanasensis]|uniref:hypothetical protein n=1 Tax=Streptomyces kanasensis TaxID=936756 RepID=UPI0037F7ED6B